jgi:hypothetical protein
MMFMKKILFIIIVSIAQGANAQEKMLPVEAKPFVAKGYEMMDYISGDLNGDKKPDGILILKVLGEDTASMEDIVRPFIILTRQANGKLKQEKRNDNLVLCRQCGGVFGDPYDNTSITPNGFSIDFYGGSSWRWGSTYRFAWKPAKKNWYLVYEKQTSFQSGDPENTTKEVEIEETELGDMTFEDYGKNVSTDYGKWKVTAAKTFFYDNPKLGSKPRKGYLLKGDSVTVLRVLKNFAEVSFENSKSQFSTGYVLKKDLEKIN